MGDSTVYGQGKKYDPTKEHERHEHKAVERRIVQLAFDSSGNDRLCCVCDDGSAWSYQGGGRWARLMAPAD